MPRGMDLKIQPADKPQPKPKCVGSNPAKPPEAQNSKARKKKGTSHRLIT